jgi:hypothetical protein
MLQKIAPRRLACLALPLGLAVALSACHATAPVQLLVDPSLEDAEVYPVSGLTNRYWGKPLSFGEFHTRKTRVGSTWAWTTGVFHVGAGVRTQPYRFLFVDETGAEWPVECRAKTPILRHADEKGEWELPLGETRLGCALRSPDDEAVYALGVAGNGIDFRGETEIAGERIEIRALHQVPDRHGRPFSIPGALGYELRQGDRVLGSVDMLGRGRVYMARDLEPELRTPVALTSAVLMFFGES